MPAQEDGREAELLVRCNAYDEEDEGDVERHVARLERTSSKEFTSGWWFHTVYSLYRTYNGSISGIYYIGPIPDL